MIIHDEKNQEHFGYNVNVKKFIWILLALFVTVVTTFIPLGWQIISDGQAPKTAQGVLDLTAFDFTRGTVRLDGEWDFYWRQLIEFTDLTAVKPDLQVQVPSSWKSYTIDGIRLPDTGYGTYHVHIKTKLPAGTLLGLDLNRFTSAYQLFINDQLVAHNGQVAVDKAGETPQFKPQMVIFTLPGSEFDLLIQVSNFQLAKGGFHFSVDLGQSAEIISRYESLLFQQYFVMGALMISGFLFLSIYLFLREQRSALYFACLCLVTVIFEDGNGQFLLTRLLPALNFNLANRIFTFAVFLVLFFYFYYLRELFPSGLAKILTRSFAVVTAVFLALNLFTQPIVFSQFFVSINSVLLIFAMSTFFIILQGLKNSVSGAGINLMAQMIIVGTFTNETFYKVGLIKDYPSGLRVTGLLLFMFLQMVVQARRIILFHQTAKTAELNMLQSQINPHFLYNTLSTIIFMSRTDWDKARTQLQNFSDYLRSSFNFKSLSQFSPLSKELELTQIYLEIEKARFEERLIYEIINLANPDVVIPVLTIQPLVENAVNHGIFAKPEGGNIIVRVDQAKHYLTISVKDNGVGIPPDKLLLLQSQFKSHLGVGLVNIDTRLTKLYGRGLQIESTPGGGTTVWFRVPTRKASQNDLAGL